MASVAEEVAQLRGTKPATAKDLLSHKPFVRLAAAMTVSSFGDWVGFVAVTYLVAEFSNNNGFAVAGVMFARMLPSLFFGPFIGAIIDRFDRKKVMMTADIGRAVLYATMPFLGSLWGIYLLSFAIESLSLVWSPARDASLPKLVPRRQLANANSIAIISTYGTLPLGGAAYAVSASLSAWIGQSVPYFATHSSSLALWLDATTFIFSAVMISTVPIQSPAKASLRKLKMASVGKDAMDGIRFLREHPLAGSMTIGILIAFSAVGAVVSVGPLLVKELGGGGTGWGVLVTAFGAGMAAGLLSVTAVTKLLDREHVFYLAMIGGGFALTLLAIAPSVGYAAALAVPLGFLVGLTWVLGYTLLQESVSDEFRGRTFSTLNVLSKLGLLACLVLFPAIGTTAGASNVPLLSANDGWSFALLLAGVAVVTGGLYTRVGLYRYRMMKPRALGLIPKLKKAPAEGVFVVFEGVEGSGKGTQIEMAEKTLLDEEFQVMVTREPGGTPLGEKLREMLLDPDSGRIEPRTEALMFGAARSQMVSTVIRPALEAGKIVICDRYIDSSVAYQGFARGVGETDVLSLNVWATQGLFPDLVVLLHLEPEEGLKRAGAEVDLDRIESEGMDFHAKVADAYLHIAEEHPERVVVIDATQSPDQVHDAVMNALRGILPEHREKKQPSS